MTQQKTKRNNILVLSLLILIIGGLSGWQIAKTTGFLPKKTLPFREKEPEQFTLIGTCNNEACLFKNGKTILGTATLRGYYKTNQEEMEDYIKGDSGGKLIVNVKKEFLIVSKTLSRDSLPLIEYLVPESTNSTEDDVSIEIRTNSLEKEDKKILIEATEDKPVEVKVQSHTPTRSGGGPFATTIYVDLLSVK